MKVVGALSKLVAIIMKVVGYTSCVPLLSVLLIGYVSFDLVHRSKAYMDLSPRLINFEKDKDLLILVIDPCIL